LYIYLLLQDRVTLNWISENRRIDRLLVKQIGWKRFWRETIIPSRSQHTSQTQLGRVDQTSIRRREVEGRGRSPWKPRNDRGKGQKFAVTWYERGISSVTVIRHSRCGRTNRRLYSPSSSPQSPGPDSLRWNRDETKFPARVIRL
jgi:hypothetical protein